MYIVLMGMIEMENKNKGKFGEDIAVKYLVDEGYQIIERNINMRYAEIDIIGLKEDYIIFFEVKHRLNDKYGRPVESVNKAKQSRIIKAAKQYWYFGDYYHYQPRFDVIEVFFNNGKYNINAIENAYGEN